MNQRVISNVELLQKFELEYKIPLAMINHDLTT